jgi:hypothetical protein
MLTQATSYQHLTLLSHSRWSCDYHPTVQDPLNVYTLPAPRWICQYNDYITDWMQLRLKEVKIFFLPYRVVIGCGDHLISHSVDSGRLRVRVFERVGRPKLEANNSQPSHTVVTDPINVGFELQMLPRME